MQVFDHLRWFPATCVSVTTAFWTPGLLSGIYTHRYVANGVGGNAVYLWEMYGESATVW